MRTRQARIELSIFVGLLVVAVAPLFSGRYLPFLDYPAHLSVPAALRLRGDPATQVSSLWYLDLRVVPNCLHYALTYLGSFVMPLETASRLFVAVFCIAALPPAAAFLLRTFGRDWRLAVLVVPVSWNSCLWYGFIGFCAALPMSLLALALIERDLRRPSWRREVLLTALIAILPLAHFFVAAVTIVLAIALLLMHAKDAPVVGIARSAMPLTAAPAVIAPWFLRSLHSGPQPSGGVVTHLFASRPRAVDYAAHLRRWFIDGYAGWFDDALAAMLIVTLALLLVYPKRIPTGQEVSRSTRLAPVAISVILIGMYLVLPFEIQAPFHWWGMNVRVLPLLFVWLLVAVPTGRLDRFGRLVLIPAMAGTLGFLIYVTVDIRLMFNGPKGMAGLDDVLEHIPPGAQVLGLYTDYHQAPHYAAEYPFHYASSYAVLRGGGVAAPFIPIPQSWTNPRVVPEYPMAGDAARFRFDRHAPGFSYFLVRTCVGERCTPDPLDGRTEVSRVAESGRWRLYACATAPCGDSVPHDHSL